MGCISLTYNFHKIKYSNFKKLQNVSVLILANTAFNTLKCFEMNDLGTLVGQREGLRVKGLSLGP